MRTALFGSRNVSRAFRLLCLGVLHLVLSASVVEASPTCRTQFAGARAVELASPLTVLTKLYDRSQFLGIAVADHSNFQPFQRLLQILAARGFDRRLKTVVIEDSHVRADVYASLSVKPMSRSEFEKAFTADYPNLHPQDVFMFEHVFPLLQKINASRPDDPILAVPVDGLTTPTAMETAWGMSTPARSHSMRLERAMPASKVPNVYGGSILRERETAAHFKRLVTDRFPGRKSIIIYQGAHIFKNLRAVGADTDANGKVVKRAFLGWISIAAEQVPELKRSYDVVAVDNKSEQWAPRGQLNLPEGLQRHPTRAVGAFWRGTTAAESPLFTEGSFMATYRNSTITSIRPDAAIFDAVIVEP